MSTKLCIVGAPSCRKTTVAEQLKIRLKTTGYNAELAPESARTYIMKFGAPTHPAEQMLIAMGQIDIEDLISGKHDIVICDSASFLSYIYTMRLGTDKKTEAIKEEVHRLVMPYVKTYDYVFFAPKQGPMVNDNVRFQTNEETIEISNQIKGFLDLERIPYVTLNGSIDEKVAQILKVLGA